MNTVQKNNTITRRQVQELLGNNQEKLQLSDKNLKKLIKAMRSNTISRQMRKIFYQECLMKIERKYGLTINDLPHGRGYFKKQKNVHTITKEISEKKKEISIEVMPEEIKRKETDTHFEGESLLLDNGVECKC